MRCAERHTNAYFPNAAAHSVGENPVDPDDCKDKSKPGKCAEQEHVEPLGRQRCGDKAFHGNHVHYGQFGIHTVNGGADSGSSTRRIGAGTYGEAHSKRTPTFPRLSSHLADRPGQTLSCPGLAQSSL